MSNDVELAKAYCETDSAWELYCKYPTQSNWQQYVSSLVRENAIAASDGWKGLPSGITGDEALRNLATTIVKYTDAESKTSSREIVRTARQLAELVLQIKYAVFK